MKEGLKIAGLIVVVAVLAPPLFAAFVSYLQWCAEAFLR